MFIKTILYKCNCGLAYFPILDKISNKGGIMKKFFVILGLLVFVTTLSAKGLKGRPLIEGGPKASLYIGSVAFGIGGEVVVNPLKNMGFRFNLAEIHFNGGTLFTVNQGSLDALLYIPMQELQPYVHAGLGLVANGGTTFYLSGGMGFNFTMNRGTDVFVEPGIIISSVSVEGADNTDVQFRLSAGARFGLIK